MKRVLFIIPLIFYVNIGLAQQDECLKNIKEGTFVYMASGTEITVKRTKKKQIEFYNNGKSKVVNKVEWISDTEYYIIFVKAKNSPGCLKKGDKMKVTISECTENSYHALIVTDHCGGVRAETTLTRK